MRIGKRGKITGSSRILRCAAARLFQRAGGHHHQTNQFFFLEIAVHATGRFQRASRPINVTIRLVLRAIVRSPCWWLTEKWSVHLLTIKIFIPASPDAARARARVSRAPVPPYGLTLKASTQRASTMPEIGRFFITPLGSAISYRKSRPLHRYVQWWQ